MSAINQMLRDLDARNPIQPPPVIATDTTATPPHPGQRGWGLISLGLFGLGVVIAGGYFVLNDRGMKGTSSTVKPHLASAVALTPEVPASPAAIQAVKPVALTVPVVAAKTSVSAPIVEITSQKVLAVKPVEVARNIATQPAMQKTENNANKLTSPAPSPVLPRSHESIAASAPSVIKHDVELSPVAVALQLQNEANGLRREGKLDAARGKYLEAIDRNPDLNSARIQLAETMYEQGEIDAALTLLKVAYNRRPDSDLAVAIGRMTASHGSRADALSWFSRAGTALRPADYALTATLYSQEQHYDEAVRAYQTALAADSHKGGWLLGLGLALEAVGRREEAQTAYQQALAWGDFKPEVIKFLNERISK